MVKGDDISKIAIRDCDSLAGLKIPSTSHKNYLLDRDGMCIVLGF